jgi:hypothetical protein
MRYFTICILVLFSVIGCKSSPSDNTNAAFFGGEIINPKDDKVVLYDRLRSISDTLMLDENHRFIHKLSNVDPGVYSFRHGGEFQLIILEPGDSIMLRLNTRDFDESLVFTGEGARKNNYLLKVFLKNEKESQRLVKYSKKEPEVFDVFINKRHQKELRNFNAFVAKKPISEYAVSIIEGNINYHNYADKEIYPFAYFGTNKMVHIKDLPENFYDYRSEIDYDAVYLRKFYDYNRFLSSHFDNLALKPYYKNETYHSKFNRYEIKYNKAKLNLIDSLVTNENIKNNLLRFKTTEFISHSNSQAEINDIMAYYLSRTTSEDHIKYMNGLVASMDDLKPGKGLPDLSVIDIYNKESTIADIVNKPTLIYFWSSNTKKHYRNSHYRVKELKEKFPQIAFMAINIDDNSASFWKETLNQYKFDLNNEFRFKNPKEALETLAVNYLYKVIIVNKKANIIHPNVNIFSDDFEMILKDVIQEGPIK